MTGNRPESDGADRLSISDVYRHLDQHRASDEPPYDVEGGLAKLRRTIGGEVEAAEPAMRSEDTGVGVSNYSRALGARLRAIRTQRGLSLHDVEKESKGRWKAVSVGSYERGDRAITVRQLAELADFYGVPVGELLPEGRAASSARRTQKIVLDLERLFRLPPDQVGPLARYVQAIQSQRGDHSSKVLAIRGEDLRSLSIIYDLSEGELAERLVEWGVLMTDPHSPDSELDRRSGEWRLADRGWV